jgi:hypothetical protein
MSRIEELENEIKGLENRKIELLKQLELEEQKTEIVYPFEKGDDYYFVGRDGSISDWVWNGVEFEKQYYKLGNAFKTEQEAIRERDKRILLTRFKQFRDKCNGDWKPDLNNTKYYIYLDCDYLMLNIFSSMIRDAFNLFGYFKNKEDCQRAIELFGDEIKRLYVEE